MALNGGNERFTVAVNGGKERFIVVFYKGWRQRVAKTVVHCGLKTFENAQSTTTLASDAHEKYIAVCEIAQLTRPPQIKFDQNQTNKLKHLELT